MSPLRLVALVAVGAIALAACGDSSSDSSGDSPSVPSAPSGPIGTGTEPASSDETTAAAATTPATTAAPDLSTALAGTFVSTGVDGFTLVDGTEVSLTFDGANISAAGGCNQLASTWTLEGDVLVVPMMAQTEMACTPPALMDQDTWLASVLTSRPTVSVDGETLTITADGATLTLVDQAARIPRPQLEGPTWVVDTLLEGDLATSLPAGVNAPTLLFEAGTVSVDTSCNTGSGPYTIDGETVTFGAIAMTRMACTDPATIAIEPQVMTVLQGTATFAIERGALTLRNGTGGLVAHVDPDVPTASAGGGLVGPTWTLEAATADGADVPVGERVPTLMFDGTSVAVDTGCNVGGGEYSADGTTITFQPLISTLIACEGPTGTMESTINAAVTGTVPFEIGADGALTITNGTTELRYTPG